MKFKKGSHTTTNQCKVIAFKDHNNIFSFTSKLLCNGGGNQSAEEYDEKLSQTRNFASGILTEEVIGAVIDSFALDNLVSIVYIRD